MFERAAEPAAEEPDTLQPLFLDWASKPLLVIHAIASVILIGSISHLAWELTSAWRKARPARPSSGLWAKIAGLSYLVSFAVGLLLYPTFRYRTRGLYLDRYEPWASNLFDIKENLLGLALPLAVGLMVLAGRSRAHARGPLPGVVLSMALAVWLIVVVSVVAGLIVTNARGV